MSSPKTPSDSMFPNDPDVTIFEHQARLRREEGQRQAQALAMIKAIHAAGPTLTVPSPRTRPGLVSRGPGAIAKFSPGVKFKGWYRAGQTRGAPSQKMPLEQELDALREAYFKSIRDLVPRSTTAAILARRSVRARRADSEASMVLVLWEELENRGVLQHNRARFIAQKLKCNVDYVRRVLRQNGLSRRMRKT